MEKHRLTRWEATSLMVGAGVGAGIMAVPFARTPAGCESQFGTNHIGHFLLTNLLLPLLLTTSKARIVNLSSGGHKHCAIDFDDLHWQTREYNKWGAYGQSKTANALFTVALQKRVGAKGVNVFAVHPGVIPTDLGRHLTADDIKALSTTQIQGLTAADIAEMTAAQIAALSSTQLRSLSEEQLTALNAEQLQGLSTTQLAALSTTQLRQLSESQIASLTSTPSPGFFGGSM